MKILKFSILFLLQFCFADGIAQSFTETFSTAPLPCGGGACTTFSRTQSGVQFDFTFTPDGDGGDFQYNSGNINALSSDINDASTERVIIARNDGNTFILSSIDIDNLGGFVSAHDIIVTGKREGLTVESQVMTNGDFGTLTFGSGSGIEVDIIELTGSFEAVLIDNFAGAIPATASVISIDDVTVTENNTTASFTVSLSAASSSTVTVDYTTANNTATAGSDYTGTSGTLTFTPGQTSKTIPVTILGDLTYENNETFYVNLSNPTNATIGDNQGLGTINNNDSPPTVALDPSVTSKAENAGSLYVVAQLSAASGLATTINFSYSGTATSGVDYTASTSLVIAAGDTRDSIPINMINDNFDEANETVIVDITSVVNGTESGGFQQSTLTINDDDETPVVTPGQSFAVNENNAASTAIGTVAATDSDAGTSFQNWAITTNANPDGDANNAFNINSTTGQLTVNDAEDLNYESNTSLTIQVTVSDGTNTSSAQNVTININDIDDVAPTITANTGMTLSEGATETINGTELQANDVDTNNDNLTFAITAAPANGQLELTASPGIAISSFTQAQLNSTQVVYVHDDSNTTSDSFTFTVQDGGGNNLTGQTFTVGINAVDDDSPTIPTNTGITLDEGATETINNTELQANDTDTNNDNLTFAITTASANGQLELTTDPGVAINSFTQAQLNANQVVYVHDGSMTTSDSFTFAVQDGSSNNLTGQIFSITINLVDDDVPTITANTGITLDEGATETVNATELQANDTDTNNDNLTYVITAGPSNGQIELTTASGIAISNFTQAQLNANQVIYLHDGGNSLSDSFNFEVRDGSGNNLTGQTFNITINAIDDTAPTLTTNTGITLNEGATATIDNTKLQADDEDTDNNVLTFAIATTPENGQVELTTDAGVAITSFTQAQLNANQIVYVHDDSNTTSDSFTFTIQDGSENNLTGQTFSITITPVDDDVPTITINTGISLNEGAAATITSTVLQANDTDTNNDNLTFAITTAPANGQLELTTGAGLAITSFTQAQLNADQVVYVHDDSNTTSDSFTFDLQDGSGNNLTGQTLSIVIALVDDDVPTITKNTGITLDEGATESITSDALQANDTDTDNDILTFVITTAPSNGQVESIAEAGTAISSFTQKQLNDNEVAYVHDGSNTTSDSFIFATQDGSGNNLVGQTFSITITEVDDDTPVLTQNSGITLNEGATEIINSTELQANDTDTDNDILTFAITTVPAHGQLELATDAGTAIASFTQKQLNESNVVYVHDDSNTTSDSFTFNVQDGRGNNLTGQTFSININAIDDDTPTVTANTGITLDEGSTEPINGAALQANDTDTENDNLTFVINTVPANGHLELVANAGIVITSFTQAQLNANEVVYVHDDSNTDSDSFTFDVQDGSSNNLAAQTFSITINPVNDDVPIAIDDSYTTDEDITLNVTAATGVLINDSDADTDAAALSAILVTGPDNGTFNLNSDGSFEYIPNQDFHGNDNFTYKVNDGINDSNVATVAITINAVNDAPFTSTLEDMEVEVNTLIDPISFEIVDVDNDLSALSVTASADNAAILPASGIVLGGSGANRTLTLEPLPDAVGSTLISISVSDGDLETITSFTLSVVVLNTPPTDINLSNTTFLETIAPGEAVGALSTVDIDQEDTFSYSLVAGTGDTDNAFFNIENDQLVASTTYDYDLQQSYSIRVRSTDNRGESVEKEFTLTIEPDSGLEPIIYTGFTPDGDGQNDTWEIDNIASYPQIVVHIFNRNGQEIFKSRGYLSPWDGTYQREELPKGTYYYVVALNDGTGRAYKGTVMILK